MQSWVVYSPCTHPRCVPGADPGLECGGASAPSLGPMFRLWPHVLVFGWGRVNFLHNVHSTNMGVHFGFVQWQMTSSSPTSCQLFRMTSQCPLDWVRSAIRGLFAIKDSIWWAAVAGWGGCETAQQTSSLMCGTASLSSPDNLECHPFHSHFLHTDCMENHTRDSFTSLTPHTSGIYGCMLLQL